MNKYTSSNSKGCVRKVHLKYPKELHKLHNDYHLAPGKIEIKREMLPECELIIADLYKFLLES